MMTVRRTWASGAGWTPALLVALLLAAPTTGWAQDEAPIPPSTEDSVATADVTESVDETYPNTFIGQFAPARGFDIVKTKRGSLNISAYGLFRWVDQTPGEQTFTDHLGRERPVKARNDINWHRTFVWLTGFFYDPKFRYNISIWSLPTTQQALVFGNLRYLAARPLTIGVGLGPNLTARSMQGSWPFWASSDRQMAEDFFRGGFSSTFFLTGEPFDRVFYTTSIATNLSQLGTTASQDSREFSYSASVWTMPTTGELGPRGGLGDMEYHTKVATRFGLSAAHAREGRYAADNLPPNGSWLKLSDGVNPFETGALAESVTVRELDYDEMAFDAAFKYKGFSFQGEAYVRRMSNFDADGPLPLDETLDKGFMLEAMHMVLPKKLGLDVATGNIYDTFDRNPWEVAGGASYYPFGNRSWRLNFHAIKVEKSPANSTFGFYTAGQSGMTYSIGTDILL